MYTRAPWAHPVAARAESAPPEPTTAAAATGWLQTTAHGTMMPPPVGMPAPQAARAGGGTGMPRAGGIPQLGPPRARAAADQTTSGFAYAKATWDTYFDHRLSLVLTLPDLGGCTTEELPADETSFQIYTAGGLVPPDKNSSDRPSACASTSAVPVYVLLHGGGLSSLSWALVAGALKRQGRTILAYDFRGHGGSAGEESELTADRLCADTLAVIEAVVGTQTPLVLVGHSLGGAIAAKVACTPQLRTQIHAIVMIDIVESVAMQSLDKMEAMLARRPPSFPTAHDAVQWATSSGMVNNPVSAAVSIPSLLRQAAVAHHQDQGARTPGTDAGSVVPAAAEEREEQAPLVWRTKLQSTAPLWPVRAVHMPPCC